jgi:prenyltransferase beta subunit
MVCLVCLAPVRAQTPEDKAKQQTVLYVQKLQTPGGGFIAELPDDKSIKLGKPSLRATSSAIRAIKYLGGELPNKDGVAKFVAGCFDKASGGFADSPGGMVDVFTTAVGLMAVVELGMPADPYHAAATKYLNDNARTFDEIRIAVAGLESLKTPAAKKDDWLKEVDKVKVPARTDEPNDLARVLASKTVTYLRLGVTLKNTEEILKDLRAGQRGNGGWGKDESPKSDLETTYRVMRAFMMLKAQPKNVDALKNFIHKCRNEDAGYGVAPAQPSNISGVYYAAIITHWLDEKKK